jgi:glycosyltransferase involved in cell wall biosynthesis
VTARGAAGRETGMKIKVCHVLSDVDQSHLIETHGEVLDKEKYEVGFVFMGAKRPQLYDFFKANGYETEFFDFRGRKDLPAAVWRLKRIFGRLRPDIVHTHLVEATLAGLTAAKLARVKGLVHTRHHGAESHVYYPHGVYYDKYANRLSQKIVAISKVVAENLTGREGADPRKVVTIPHGFDLENFAADDEAALSLGRRYGLEGRYPVVGSISRFIHWKGVQDTVVAFKQLLAEHPRAKLVLANATGPYDADIRRLLAENLDESAYVTIEFERNVFALYRNFDAFVHVPVNRDFEAFGQVYVEALAMGVPSVFTLAGIANDFVVDGENALVVPYSDPGAIARALGLILRDGALRHRIVSRGREDVWRLFHSERFGAQLDALYTGLVS